MLKIGLTGGVGTGKSTVAGLFAAKGIKVMDADKIARDLVEPRQPALLALVDKFGEEILIDGRLNRSALRELIFSCSSAKKEVEGILHPFVFQQLSDQAEHLTDPYCIFDIPLIIETGQQAFVDRILVIDCQPEQQLARVRSRDGLADDDIERVIAAQASREERLACADDILENNGTIFELADQVEKLHQAYLLLGLGQI